MPAARPVGSELCADRATPTHAPATSQFLRAEDTSCADVDRGKLEDPDAGGTKGRGALDEGEAVRLGEGTLGSLHAGGNAPHGECEAVVKKGTGSPKGECSVTAGARQAGRGLESGGEVARTNALATTKKRVEQGAYALVQLSTRCVFREKKLKWLAQRRGDREPRRYSSGRFMVFS